MDHIRVRFSLAFTQLSRYTEWDPVSQHYMKLWNDFCAEYHSNTVGMVKLGNLSVSKFPAAAAALGVQKYPCVLKIINGRPQKMVMKPSALNNLLSSDWGNIEINSSTSFVDKVKFKTLTIRLHSFWNSKYRQAMERYRSPSRSFRILSVIPSISIATVCCRTLFRASEFLSTAF